ncbi:MAG TPA: DegT/DnrJ/EryC1/StrS family aminotransferase [Anaerolineae bacterium]|nr:DegT/DnrJ/EryC1/StrS family aminotransferase [Anaerolineae bacterium]HNU05076.1 DegT/DnrJ/EryC1/StrS family aminotransferase [Anaerolineae bacterium]
MKRSLEDLALFGGPAAFAETLHVGRPNVGDRARLLARIDDMLDRRWLTNHGPFVEELEQQLAAYLGVKHCIAMCNGTVALEIAARALELRGEVIVPAFTFVATAHALQWQEITPVFCDVEPHSHNLDPQRIEALITPRTTGIVGVHVWGQPCAVDALTDIARRRNLRLMFDAAHAFGCSYRGQMIGNFGDAEVFSFHATKFFNTFEGGAVTTNDDALAAKIRLMQNFGFAGLDRVIYIGTNGKMSEVSAAMGLTGLESLTEFVAINQRNYEHYHRELAEVSGLRLLRYDPQERNNFQYITAEIDAPASGISRDHLVQVLHAENVRARRYFYPGCHQMEPYRSYFPHARLLLPVTEQLTQRVLILPTGTAIDAQAISQISQLIRFVVEHGAEISARLAAPARSAA